MQGIDPTKRMNGKTEEVRPVAPVCPYCGSDPAVTVSLPYQMSPGVVGMTVFCANQACRKILWGQIVHVEQPMVQAPPAGKLII